VISENDKTKDENAVSICDVYLQYNKNVTNQYANYKNLLFRIR
jgi:hypothetical protein